MPSRYYLEGVLTDVLVDVNIRCSAADMNNFLPPANVTCGDYAAQFLANNTGYINNPSASSPVCISEIFFYFSSILRIFF